ncbi:hypothetical protein PXK58_08860 [Phaeobacter gallaeciensis]|uniref:hypothetical protein n=1 Tax=Phaeobacter gallaeciensis TaxID=60890 RepID=UPI00238043F7|nr:hypothetical protein [Phaeobacter gallaeciensis]MDE4274765.1 hypothetical protein [Phaeobacter gallaeciensis]MDE4299661.1 hypothetical protein [Phaeobacter gallaeciensis]MDE5184826.1 hypothetical protein [Phaeobacter gallaeciensis]
MTPEEAQRIQNAYDRLKPLIDSGKAREPEIRAFRALEAGLRPAQDETGATNARYRGAMVSATGGLADEAAGVASFLKGDGYNAGREESLEKSQTAMSRYPDEFQTGRTAGGGFLGAASMAVGGPALKGLGMLGKMAAGGGMGSAIGLGQGQANYELAGRPEGERLDYYKAPVAIGAASGALAYPAGKAVGSVAKALRNRSMKPATGFGRFPSNTMAKAISNTEDSGQDVAKYLAGLTDEATLADVPGDLQGTAQGLVALRGPGGSKVAREITERAQRAGERISGQMDDSIRPANAAFAERRALAAQRTGTLGPEYEAALQAGGAVDARNVIRKMDEAMRVAGPDTAPVIARFAADLRNKAPNGLIDPAQLHWIRSDLSDALNGIAGPSKKNAILTGALDDIDSVLDTVPGYADARTGYANNRAMERAIDEGQTALRGGRATATSPDEFKAYFDNLSDAQKEAFRTGLRRDIDGLMGTSSNDAVAAWREFSDKGWNEAKLRIALGDEAADPIIRRLRSEKVFSETRGKVVAGTRTAETQEAREALGPYRDPQTGRQPGPIARAKGVADDAINSVVDSLLYRGTGRRNAELGDMLTLTGAKRDELLKALTDLSNRQAVPSKGANSLDAVVRALLMGAGASAAARQ